MSDKKMIFLSINMLVTVLCLGLIIGTSFIDNESTKTMTIWIAVGILIIQKIIEIIVIKETRKISIAVLIILVAAAGYFGYKL